MGGCNSTSGTTVTETTTSGDTFKLTYFDFTGRAEVVRLLFALGNQKYEDKRISQEEWKALKPKTPTGGLPLLEVNGKTISQSVAIARFVARRLGLAGKNNLEAARADMVVDSVNEIVLAGSAVSKASDDQKEEVMKKFVGEILPGIMEKLEKILNGKKWFVGNSVTWADVMYYSILGIMLPSFQFPVPWDKAPNGKKLVDRVGQLPQIKAWNNKQKAAQAKTSYKLTYFDMSGRGETSRLLLAMAKQEFEDVRITQDEWKSMKSKTPTGGLPILEVDGKVISQSLAIARFIARKHGFAGKDNLEAAKADMVADSVNEVLLAAAPIPFLPDDQKEEAMQKFIGETLPGSLEKLEKMLNGKKWFVGNNVTWADVLYYCILGVAFQEFQFPIPWDKAPNGKKLVDRVGQIPEVKAWRDKH